MAAVEFELSRRRKNNFHEEERTTNKRLALIKK
jgi:hypothetical protein